MINDLVDIIAVKSSNWIIFLDQCSKGTIFDGKSLKEITVGSGKEFTRSNFIWSL